MQICQQRLFFSLPRHGRNLSIRCCAHGLLDPLLHIHVLGLLQDFSPQTKESSQNENENEIKFGQNSDPAYHPYVDELAGVSARSRSRAHARNPNFFRCLIWSGSDQN